MNCKQCGSLLTENDQFCKTCGAPVNTPIMQGGSPMPSQNVQPAIIAQQPMNAPINQPSQPINGMNNGLNPAPVQQKSNGTVKYIVTCIIMVAAIFAGIYLFNVLKGSGNSGNNGGGTAVPVTQKSYKVDHQGYTFEIPDNYVYKISGNWILIGNEDDTWVAQIRIESGSYAKLKENITQLPTVLQKMGLTATVANTKTLGGVEFITMEFQDSGKKGIYGLTRVNAMNFADVVVSTKDNEYDYKILEKVAPIISSAEQTVATNNISPDIQIDGDQIAELAK